MSVWPSGLSGIRSKWETENEGAPLTLANMRENGVDAAAGLGWAPKGGGGMRALDNNDIVHMLRTEVKKTGSQMAWAKKVGIDRAFINKVLHGRQQPTERIILALGLRRVPRQRVDIQKLRPTKELDVEDVLRLLRAEVQRTGSITAFAKIAGVDRTTVHRVLRGQMPPSPKIVHALGLRMVVFVPK
jgi:DNA-binding phage protein